MTAHWAIPGRVAEISLAFAETYRMLNNRIDLFMNLPIAALDRMALQKRVDEIGQRRE